MSATFVSATGISVPTTAKPLQVCKQTPTCLAARFSRRCVLKLASLTTAVAFLPRPARSETTYEKNIRKKVAKVILARSRAQDLKDVASSWNNAMTEDDELYVLRFIPIWLEPARLAMADIGNQADVDVGDTNSLKNKAGEMMGHLLELRMESKARKKAGVLRELDEFVETAEDFLTLPGIKRFAA